MTKMTQNQKWGRIKHKQERAQVYFVLSKIYQIQPVWIIRCRSLVTNNYIESNSSQLTTEIVKHLTQKTESKTVCLMSPFHIL